MSLIDDVRADRTALATVLKKHRGIRRTVEELYPDNAHFIYELLQNAEDTGATAAHFILTEGELVFEHNGRPFEERDVWAITDIGEGTKTADQDKIGRFGVGFKAVFAYTESPTIWSPTFSFRIADLVLPFEIDAVPAYGTTTRFAFPFNNPKKTATDAYAEIVAGLRDLSETTLLFLTNLTSVRWTIDGNVSEIARVEHSGAHVEVVKKSDGAKTAALHFLRFSQAVPTMPAQRVAVAFALDWLPGKSSHSSADLLQSQFRIVSAVPGRVAVFFPAAKEVSELRFHLHAPFVPELSRASIKDTAANTPLFEQLARLTAASLHEIRDLGLLTVEFLGVLPNDQDELPVKYRTVRSAVLGEMNRQALTPTLERAHAPAERLVQAKASLKELLSSADIEFLIEYSDDPPLWAASAPQRNSNADRLLGSLAVRRWDVSDFVSHIASSSAHWAPDAAFMKWLGGKTEEWHQQFYAFLYFELHPNSEWARVASAQIVRRMDGSYGTGGKTYFLSGESNDEEALPRVAPNVYSSGRSKTQQEAAKKALEAIGVREVGEIEYVRAILDQRYTSAKFSPSLKDLKRFIALVEKDPAQKGLFEKYFILKRVDGKWGMPSQVFWDAPYADTGLGAFFASANEADIPVSLSPEYAEQRISTERLRKFAEAVGVRVGLQIITVSCSDNPQWPYLCQVGGERWSSPINTDYTIAGLASVLSKPTLETARLIWKTMCGLRSHDALTAIFQKNGRYGHRIADSQLVHSLRNHAWIPQSGGSFATPLDAQKDLLPHGFPFDAGDEWLKRIQFGQRDRHRADEVARRDKIAKDLGFSDARSLERAKTFASLPNGDQEEILAEIERKKRHVFPTHEPQNPERRGAKVAEQAKAAPERITEQRSRAVSVGREAVKNDTEEYLRQQYTSPDGELFCQLCQAPMPFKLPDGSYYFEKVEFLPVLKRRHYQNYLALCPNHAAMFVEANESHDLLKDIFIRAVEGEIPVVLAQRELTIKFTKTHLSDLKQVIAADDTLSS